MSRDFVNFCTVQLNQRFYTRWSIWRECLMEAQNSSAPLSSYLHNFIYIYILWQSSLWDRLYDIWKKKCMRRISNKMYKKLKAVLFILFSTLNVPSLSNNIVKDMGMSSSVHVLKYTVKSMIFQRPSSSDIRKKIWVCLVIIL